MLRTLRVIGVVAFLALVVIVVIDPDRADNLPLIGLLVGAVLLQLGYEVALPGIADRRTRSEPPPRGERRKPQDPS